MELTVLGRHGPFPAPGGACSGYLLRAGQAALLLDLGPGTLSRLLAIAPQLDLDCVILSHLHSDHISDMFVLRYALRQFAERGLRPTLPMPVIAPDEPKEEYRLLTASGVFDLASSADGLQLRIRDARIRLNRVTHPVPTYAVSVEHEGKRFVYTGDTGARADLAELCYGADLLLADANFLDEENPGPSAPHLSAGQAGQLAADAWVKRLLCTHIRGALCDTDRLIAQARRRFPGAELAEELAVYQI
ncbi:MAG TPA: MBL fold metallo-hydrolase [Clostridia bacterium]|nr:MAG: ribonuclease Z [Firmicutes bacterium ADurb.Bin248]HOG00957.1 MBL fold metallo-hydrolase [Clostridia bacterium]HOS19025.1 MBL fold metallo-hydrolase [Clostridia bacterium]HPK15519.1 MBL fold metallo-hydrolase [Clostridia bacterium]